MNKEQIYIIDRDIFLDDFSIKRYKLNAKGKIDYYLKILYEIERIDEENVRIEAKIKSGFTPKSMFEANMTFSIFVEFEKCVEDQYINDNIQDIVYPIASECNYILAMITKNMTGIPLVLPPRITECKHVEKKIKNDKKVEV